MQPGTPEFLSKWGEMSQNPNFIGAQREFMFKDYADIRDKLFYQYGIDPNNDAALANAVFSLADQHGVGGGSKIIDNVLGGKPWPSTQDLVSSLYDERMRKDANGALVHFPRIKDPRMQQSIYNRLGSEK